MLDAENVYLSFLPVMSFLSYSKKLSQNLFEELKKEEEMYGYILYTDSNIWSRRTKHLKIHCRLGNKEWIASYLLTPGPMHSNVFPCPLSSGSQWYSFNELKLWSCAKLFIYLNFQQLYYKILSSILSRLLMKQLITTIYMNMTYKGLSVIA